MNLTSLKLIARTNWSWLEAPANYLPGDAYTFVIHFFKDSTNKFSISGVSESGQWRMSITSGNNTKASGLYTWQAFATKDGLNTLVDSGTITIYPNLAVETDPRTPWTIIYENLLDAYNSLSSQEASEVALYDGTRVTYEDKAKLVTMIEHAKQKMEMEINPNIKTSKKFLTRFV